MTKIKISSTDYPLFEIDLKHSQNIRTSNKHNDDNIDKLHFSIKWMTVPVQ